MASGEQLDPDSFARQQRPWQHSISGSRTHLSYLLMGKAATQHSSMLDMTSFRPISQSAQSTDWNGLKIACR